jgi:hypothetical protein
VYLKSDQDRSKFGGVEPVFLKIKDGNGHHLEVRYVNPAPCFILTDHHAHHCAKFGQNWTISNEPAAEICVEFNIADTMDFSRNIRF